ncbi:MAG: hypothetical protein QHJ82_07030, partial [Verrucomicrobiota bacterium]|nr:hypothetical protein [Verrucomicrobiota bacterium]
SGGLIRVLFPATGSQGIFHSPAWLKARGCKNRGVVRWATLVPAAPGWEIGGPRNLSGNEAFGFLVWSGGGISGLYVRCI